MSIYLDTSVLVAGLTFEPDSARAQALLSRRAAWVISEWTAAEFSAAIRTKARGGFLATDQAPVLEAALADIMSRHGRPLPIQPEDIRQARLLVMRDDGVRAPDAVHIAAALRIGAGLATLDTIQARVAGAAGLEVIVP
ncbi:type II toxin-antitoxin system VapC family toxin [uncultured Brevundimonas sp.]|uniref:type II toxin-antitoxin system VapC family toxin n=1 Tax=uncultured Brevundimonas sp. TaxID=213418 RepID=UPI0026308949|nr:type II toxin-antitoxin system VapC family toxin [uncultured Brevundimonas sp.]